MHQCCCSEQMLKCMTLTTCSSNLLAYLLLRVVFIWMSLPVGNSSLEQLLWIVPVDADGIQWYKHVNVTCVLNIDQYKTNVRSVQWALETCGTTHDLKHTFVFSITAHIRRRTALNWISLIRLVPYVAILLISFIMFCILMVSRIGFLYKIRKENEIEWY